MPVPSAVISVAISADDSILSKRARSTLRILPRKGSTAWLARLRPCLAEPPAQSPSTMKISHLAGSRSWQSASLPGSARCRRARPCARVSSRALRAASRAAAASTTLPTMARGFRRVLLEPAAELLQHHALDRGAHFGGDQLVLGLRREFRVGHLDREHAGQALAAILAGQRHALLFLRCRDLVGVFGHHAGQRRAEARPDACRRRAGGCCW